MAPREASSTRESAFPGEALVSLTGGVSDRSRRREFFERTMHAAVGTNREMRLRMRFAWIVLALGVSPLVGCVVPAASSSETSRCTLADFKTDGSIGARWNAATKTLVYGRPGADGH